MNQPAQQSVAQDAHISSCVICMGVIDPNTRAELASCVHQFCFECILTWSKEKSICPLCKLPFKELHHQFNPDGSYSVRMIEQNYIPQPVYEGSQFDALDHNYFLAEVTRVLEQAENTQRQWFRERRQNPALFQKQVNVTEQRSWEMLEEVINRLHLYKQILAEQQRIEAIPLLQELYELQDMLQEVYNGRFDIPTTTTVAAASTTKAAARRRYGADDDYDEYDDDYDDHMSMRSMKVSLADCIKVTQPKATTQNKQRHQRRR